METEARAVLVQEDLRKEEIPARVALVEQALTLPEAQDSTMNMAPRAVAGGAIKAPAAKKVATGTNGKPTAALG